MNLNKLNATIMRGGTSRGVFIKDNELPDIGKEDILIKLIGSPDPLQIDGLGGGVSSTSKAIIVSSKVTDKTIKYLFAQIYVDRPKVDYNGNCGNLTSAVGPYSVDNNLLKVPISGEVKEIEVPLYNINTNKKIISRFNIINGKPDYAGNNNIDGVPNTGVAVYYDIMDPVGTIPGKKPIIEPDLKINLEGKKISVSVLDVTSVYAYVNANDIGLKGIELPHEINSNGEILNKLHKIKIEIKKELGDLLPPESVGGESEMSLRLVAVSKMKGYIDTWGNKLKSTDGDILVRAFSLGKMHHSVPFTAAMCTAAAMKIPDTIVYKLTSNIDGNEVRIAHPKGIAKAYVSSENTGGKVHIKYVGGYRTSRPIMRGEAFIQS